MQEGKGSQVNQIKYRKLGQYKYQLAEPHCESVPFGLQVDATFIRLTQVGLASSVLDIAKGYAWDGPSGPTIDTLSFMRGSLVHDALYQLIRMEKLPVKYRDDADKLLRSMCIEDGMSRFRAWYVYQSVKWFGASSAKPGTQKPMEIFDAPPSRVKEGTP